MRQVAPSRSGMVIRVACDFGGCLPQAGNCGSALAILLPLRRSNVPRRYDNVLGARGQTGRFSIFNLNH